MRAAEGHSCLDRQVWAMLQGRQASLARGSDLARRIDPRFGPFAAACDASTEAQAALAALLDGPDDEMWLVEPHAWNAPAGTRVLRHAALTQMLAPRRELSLTILVRA